MIASGRSRGQFGPIPPIGRIRLFLAVLVGAACLWLAFRRVPVVDVWRTIASARALPLALAVSAIMLATMLRAWRWLQLFPAGDVQVRFARLWCILLVAQMFNILAPARLGEFARLYLVERTARRPMAQTLGTIAVEKAQDTTIFLAMLWILSLGAVLPGTLRRAGDAVSLSLGAVLAIVVLIVIFGERSLGLIARSTFLPDRLKQPLLRRLLGPLVEGFGGQRRVGALLSTLGLSVITWGAAWLANYFCLVALDIDRPALAALLVLVVLQLGTAVPMSPGALGVFEYLCVLALGVFAVPQGLAVSYGLLLHVVAYLPPLVLGAAILGLGILPWRNGHGRTTERPRNDHGKSNPAPGTNPAAGTNPAPGTSNPEPGTRHLNPEPGTPYPAPGTRHPAPDPVLVSVIIPCLNEADHIERLLEAIRLQDEPPHEVVVVDGGSTDGTLAIVERYRDRHADLRVIPIRHPEGHIPASLNAGIRAASGDVVARLDAHSRPRPDYLRRLVALLRVSGAGVVGGRWEIEPGSPGPVGHAIAWAVQHPLGAGDAAYRVSGCAEGTLAVDTVPFGCFAKSLWEAVGGFNESLRANEDYEFNYRVRRAGRDVLLDASAVSVYVARATLGSLARQYFWYGWWKLTMLKRNPRALRWRQAVPIVFVGVVCALGAASFINAAGWPWLAVAVAPYLVVVGLVSEEIARRRRAWQALPALPLVFMIVHFAWGCGAWVNALTFGRWPRWT